MDRLSRQPPLFWVAVASCAILIVGGFAPWATAFRGIASVSGTDGGDGWFPVVGGLLSLLTLYLAAAGFKRRHSVVLLLVAALSIHAFVFNPIWLFPPAIAMLLNLRLALAMKDKSASDLLYAVLDPRVRLS